MRIAVCFAGAAILAGCASVQTPPGSVEQIAAPATSAAAQATPFTPAVTMVQARRILTAERSRVWKDPDSVREAKIGEPFECLNKDGRTCICLEANARTGAGGFAGLKYYVVVMTPNKAEMSGEFFAPEHCGRMVAFPEMNGRR